MPTPIDYKMHVQRFVEDIVDRITHSPDNKETVLVHYKTACALRKHIADYEANMKDVLVDIVGDDANEIVSTNFTAKVSRRAGPKRLDQKKLANALALRFGLHVDEIHEIFEQCTTVGKPSVSFKVERNDG